MIELVWPGLVLGFVGSLHCVGMCGPIAIALPQQSGSKLRALVGRTLYNGGRAVTYGVLGLLAGLIGEVVSLADMQQVLSIGAGVLIILAVLLPSKMMQRLVPNNVTGKLWQRIGRAAGGLFRSKAVGAMLIIGLINGLLPCGLVYVALAGAAATGDVANSVIFMLLFGLGTVPIMVATSMFGPLMGQNLRRRLVKLVPVGAIVLAVLLILRGLSLGIPYISPDLTPTQAENGTTEMKCCH